MRPIFLAFALTVCGSFAAVAGAAGAAAPHDTIIRNGLIFDESMGPLTPKMKQLMVQRQSDIHYPVDWTTLGEYLTKLEKRGIAPNVASFVGAGTVRTNLLEEADIQPTDGQLDAMRRLVRQAMEEGALGVTTALIYSPNQYAKTPELVALARESARCVGIYIAHIRTEGDRILEAVQETIDIARASGAPAEIYHLKIPGQPNWEKAGTVLARIEAARAEGTRITAADLVIFDPAVVQDHATYEKPHQLATGIDDVWVNGVQALEDGVATGAASGKFVRGRAWTGASAGGCRASSHDWTWSK